MMQQAAISPNIAIKHHPLPTDDKETPKKGSIAHFHILPHVSPISPVSPNTCPDHPQIPRIMLPHPQCPHVLIYYCLPHCYDASRPMEMHGKLLGRCLGGGGGMRIAQTTPKGVGTHQRLRPLAGGPLHPHERPRPQVR